MPDILTRYWLSLSASARDMRDRRRMRAFARVRNACACGVAAAKEDERASDAPTQTERLERIALYARAGYFNMGYTVDLFQSASDLPPE